MENILEVRNLKMYYCGRRETVRAVDDVSFSVRAGETFGIVGESGCGKSTVCRTLVQMQPAPGKILGGQVIYRGKDLTSLSEKEVRAYRGTEIGMIFQNPMTSLNPVMKIRDQIFESLKGRGLTKKEMLDQAVSLLRLVDIPDPEKRVSEYVHQFSGGMRQRAMIAITLAARPKLLIADEPTTALDVTIQNQIISLIARLKKELGMSVIVITHDLGVVNEMCSRVAVMYAGRIVETAATRELFDSPAHPYTKGLIASLPRGDGSGDSLKPIPGAPPSLAGEFPGCAFADRCPHATDRCRTERPELRPAGPEHFAACHLTGGNA